MTEARDAGERRRPKEMCECVALPGRETDVRIGEGLRHDVWREVRARFPTADRCGVVADARVLELWPLPEPSEDLGLDLLVRPVPAGEPCKRRSVLADVQDALIGLRRDEPLVVVGGGAALDLGGFAAATLRRGLPWVAVATTALAMADASVGGKVAINHPRGKNLLGTFHPPRLVLSDVDYLETLDSRDRSAGLAEMYKGARIGDEALVDLLRSGSPQEPGAWIEVVHRAVAVKARIVERDERDDGPRRLLNYGHTVGHALERLVPNEALRHGEAIAVGMDAAARIAVARGLMRASDRKGQRDDLQRLGLPVDVPEGVAAASVLEVIGLDKKRKAEDRHTMVLPLDAHGAQVFEDVTEREILESL